MSDEEGITDMENFRKGGTGYGYKDIVMKQIDKIRNTYSKELIKGYWKKSEPHFIGGGGVSTVPKPIAYISDGRISYVQSIEFLYDLLLPKFVKEIPAEIKETTKRIDEMDKDKEKTSDYLAKVKIMRKLFQQLCIFLESQNWFQETEAED